jgi:hypothetical protein
MQIILLHLKLERQHIFKLKLSLTIYFMKLRVTEIRRGIKGTLCVQFIQGLGFLFSCLIWLMVFRPDWYDVVILGRDKRILCFLGMILVKLLVCLVVMLFSLF